MDELLQVCASNNLARLDTLLADPSYIQVALAHEVHPYNAVYITIPNLRVLLENTARASQFPCVKALLHFASNHDVLYNTLITRDAILAALEAENPEILQQFIAAMPESVNLDLGHLGDPLAQALHKQKFDHASYLLSHGADPNNRCAGHEGPGYHLRISAQKLPLEYTTLLLQHGALVTQSGAIQQAVEKGRVDVLKELLEHGGDVNERLRPNVGFLAQKTKFQQASETPLMIAARNGQRGATRWLLEHGASAEIEDLYRRTARTIAIESGHNDLIEVFERAHAL